MSPSPLKPPETRAGSPRLEVALSDSVAETIRAVNRMMAPTDALDAAMRRFEQQFESVERVIAAAKRATDDAQAAVNRLAAFHQSAAAAAERLAPVFNHLRKIAATPIADLAARDLHQALTHPEWFDDHAVKDCWTGLLGFLGLTGKPRGKIANMAWYGVPEHLRDDLMQATRVEVVRHLRKNLEWLLKGDIEGQLANKVVRKFVYAELNGKGERFREYPTPPTIRRRDNTQHPTPISRDEKRKKNVDDTLGADIARADVDGRDPEMLSIAREESRRIQAVVDALPSSPDLPVREFARGLMEELSKAEVTRRLKIPEYRATKIIGLIAEAFLAAGIRSFTGF
jgi:hypothetical protein